MTTRTIAGLALAVATLLANFTATTEAGQPVGWRAYSWNGGYYDPAWGAPHALVVPPTARSESAYGWGVTGLETHNLRRRQFGRAYPGQYDGGYGYAAQPGWPQHTDQFGTYYVRAPWK